MDAMILAAGRGARLKPMTNKTPKPLIEVGGLALIEIQLLRLRQGGVAHVVINLAYLGEQIKQRLGDGKQYGLSIAYSHESQGALETAGGIVQALPLLKGDSFLAVNADIICDLNYTDLINAPLQANQQACLVMVPNPPHHPNGDFKVAHNRLLATANSAKMTFSGIAKFQRKIFAPLPQGKLALAALLDNLIKEHKVQAHQHLGMWIDVGTPERLSAVRNHQVVREYIKSLR